MTAASDATIIRCHHCGTPNRVRPVARGIPRCANCHRPLPWIVSATGERYAAEIAAFGAGDGRLLGPLVRTVPNGHARAKVRCLDRPMAPAAVYRAGCLMIRRSRPTPAIRAAAWAHRRW